jgi:hypothetical protein
MRGSRCRPYEPIREIPTDKRLGSDLLRALPHDSQADRRERRPRQRRESLEREFLESRVEPLGRFTTNCHRNTLPQHMAVRH